MSFNTRNGTRGVRQPKAGPIMWLLNRFMSGRIRKDKKLMGGMNALVLTTIGKKSGTERSNPVGWFPAADGGWLIVASASGAARNPAWYYNIAAHPDRVKIEIGQRVIPVRAEQLHGDERERAWRQISGSAPRFADYAKKTDRELPVILLTERQDPSAEGTDQ